MSAAWFLFLSLILPVVLIFHHWKNFRSNGKIRSPPGPPGLPFIGNLHQFYGAKPHEFLRNLSNKYGPIMSLRLGIRPVLVISSAKMAKEALKTHDLVFASRPALVSFQKYSYGGRDVGFAAYSEYWREMRKISVVHLFSSKRVQSFRPIIEDEVSILINEISGLICSSSSSESDHQAVINLASMAKNLTSSLICRIAFGKKYDKESKETKRFSQILDESQAMFAGPFVFDYLPALSWIDKLSGMSARLEKNCKELDLFYEELINDHLNPDRPDRMKDDVLDLLIQMKDKQSSPSFGFTWDHIKAMLMDIFSAGTDTSAATITWAMTALMQHPSVMKRAQAEIRDRVGDHKGAINEEILQELHYLDAVIKETFRLYPPTPLLLPKETIGNCSMEGYDIENKTMVFINAWAIARDPKSWEKPEVFRPERFLNSSIDVKGNDFELIPFGAGRRGCPGISLGLSIVKTALANLLYYFDWELPFGMKTEDIDTEVLPGLTTHKKNPLCLKAKKYALI